MGRVAQDGLIYFPVDVDIFDDDKMLMAQELIDPDGKETFLRLCVPYIAIRLLREIYKKGYYLDWDDKICRVHANNIGNGITASVLKNIINNLIQVGFFDGNLFNKYNILTSHGIQKRWFLIMKLCRRKVLGIKNNYSLIEIKPANFKKQREIQKNETATGNGIDVARNGIDVATYRIPSGKLLQEKRFPFLFINNKSIDYKGIIKYISIIKEKEENGIDVAEKPFLATENGIDVAEKPFLATENGIDVAEKPFLATENGIDVAENRIELTKVDLQILSNVSEDFKMVWVDWINYAAAKGKTYKSMPEKKAAIEGLVRDSEYDENIAIKMIQKAMSCGWINFHKLKDEDQVAKTPKPKVMRALTDTDVEAQKEHYKRKKRN